MLNEAIVLTLINILGRSINFILFLIIANKFGATTDTDWFFLNYNVVYFFTGIVFNASENTLVPMWNNTKKIYHTYIFTKFTWYSLYILISTSLIIFTTALLVSPIIGVDHPSTNILDLIIIISILSIQPMLAFLSSVFSSYMQYERKYILPTVHLAIRTIGALPIILMNYCTTILCLSLSFLAGETLRFMVMKREYLVKLFNKNKNTPSINISKEIATNTALMSISLSLIVANPLVDLIMTGHLSDGSVSLVEYAGRLRGLPALAFNGILILILGEWSRHHAQNKTGLTWKNIEKLLYPTITITFIVVLVSIISIDKWVDIIFYSNKFTEFDIFSLKSLLKIYLIGIPPLIGVFILTRAIIVYQKYKIFAAISFTMFFANIFFNVIFIYAFGLKGVAASTSLVDLFSFALFFFFTKNITLSRTNEIDKISGNNK